MQLFNISRHIVESWNVDICFVWIIFDSCYLYTKVALSLSIFRVSLIFVLWVVFKIMAQLMHLFLTNKNSSQSCYFTALFSEVPESHFNVTTQCLTFYCKNCCIKLAYLCWWKTSFEAQFCKDDTNRQAIFSVGYSVFWNDATQKVLFWSVPSTNVSLLVYSWHFLPGFLRAMDMYSCAVDTGL